MIAHNKFLHELLDGLSIEDLQNLVQLKKNMLTESKPVKQRRPIPTPQKTVQQMAKDYEDNIILPPVEFRNDYRPVPAP